jgi:hypothetical protein
LFTEGVSSADRALIALDSLTFTEGVSTLSQLRNVTDTLALSEALSMQAALTAVDAAALVSEIATGGEFRNVSVADLATFTEGVAVVTTQTLLAVSDAFLLTEARTTQANLERTDFATLTEALIVAAALNASDSAVVSETALIALAMLRSDAFSFIDFSSLSTQQFVRIISYVVAAAATIGSVTAVAPETGTTLTADDLIDGAAAVAPRVESAVGVEEE